MKMTSKSVVKKKKLQTTLGKAIETPEEQNDDVDVSHVGRPIATSIYGLRDAVALLQNATPEVKTTYITKTM